VRARLDAIDARSPRGPWTRSVLELIARHPETRAADLAPLLGPCELVTSNILRSANVRLLAAVLAALAPRAIAIFAGMETVEGPLFRPVLAGAGFTVLDEALDADWWAVAARRT